MHTPISMPEMIENGFAISPGTETFLAVTPEMIHADEAIHGISYEKRGCYLEDEKSLSYFRHYSFLNCFLECSSNFTADVSKIHFKDSVFLFFSLDMRMCGLLHAQRSR